MRLQQLGYASAQEPDRARLLICLGDTCLQDHKLAEAEDAYGEALAIYKRRIGPDCVELAMPLLGLEKVYERKQKFSQAEASARQALAVLDAHVGAGDPRVETAINSVLGVACRNGRCQDEVELYDRLVQVRAKKLGADHAFTIAARQMLAEAYVHKKNYRKAIELLEANVASARKTGAHGLPMALTNLGSALEISGEAKAALPLVEEAERIQAASPGSYFPQQLLATLRLKAQLLFDLGHYSEAADTNKLLLSRAKTMLDPRNPVLADYYVALADSLKKIGRNADAQAAQKEAERLYAGR